MIYGVGHDIVHVSRIGAILAAHGERFLSKVFTEEEISSYGNRRHPEAFLAKRFAAKEAFGKALGTGLRAPATWKAIWVTNSASGKPELHFSERLQEAMRARRICRAHLALSDERDLASATVVLECFD